MQQFYALIAKTKLQKKSETSKFIVARRKAEPRDGRRQDIPPNL